MHLTDNIEHKTLFRCSLIIVSLSRLEWSSIVYLIKVMKAKVNFSHKKLF